jgi:hypothetical protein
MLIVRPWYQIQVAFLAEMSIAVEVDGHSLRPDCRVIQQVSKCLPNAYITELKLCGNVARAAATVNDADTVPSCVSAYSARCCVLGKEHFDSLHDSPAHRQTTRAGSRLGC